MNKIKIEKALQNAIHSAPTLSFTELVALPYIKVSEYDYITAQVEKKKNPARIRQFTLAAVCCLLVILPLSNWYLQNRIADSTITLDVNPSVEIITNHRDKVLSVKALNDDAQAIVGDDDYKDADLEKMVTSLLKSLVDNEYIDADKNTILLTVMNKKFQKAEAILTQVDTTIRRSLEEQNITPTIMKQIISKETNRFDLANQYHISEGKMNLIQSIISANSKFTLDMLANMSMEQLLRLAKENSMDISDFLPKDDQKATPPGETSEETAQDSSKEDQEEKPYGKSDEEKDEEGEDSDEKDQDRDEDSLNDEEDEDNRDVEKEAEDNRKDGDNHSEEDDREEENKEDDSQMDSDDSDNSDDDQGDESDTKQDQEGDQEDDQYDETKEDDRDQEEDITKENDEEQYSESDSNEESNDEFQVNKDISNTNDSSIGNDDNDVETDGSEDNQEDTEDDN